MKVACGVFKTASKVLFFKQDLLIHYNLQTGNHTVSRHYLYLFELISHLFNCIDNVPVFVGQRQSVPDYFQPHHVLRTC